jgi:hypothetical protein
MSALSQLCTISAQFVAEHQITAGSHPSYRHEEPVSPTTCITLSLTGGLLVRIEPVHSELQILEHFLGFREVVTRSAGGGDFGKTVCR